MKLNEIIDLEYHLYRDAQSDPAGVRERDRRIGRDYSGPSNDRPALFRFWLKEMKNEGAPPGQSVVSGLTFLRYSVFILFLISGAITCAGLLAYDGSRPVNIVNFIALFVGFQVILYLLFILNILPGAVRGRIPFIGDFYRFAGFLLRRAMQAAVNHPLKNRTESIRRITGIYHKAVSRHIVYQKIERWTLFNMTQLAGFAFSLGALAACLWLVTFSDLAFAWNTTLDISSETFYRIIRVISTPWAAFSKDLVPALDLIESTRFFRLNGSYSGIQTSALEAGGWWPFLVSSLLFYSVMPRLALFIISKYMLHRALAHAPFLSADMDSLHRRLTSPIFSTQTEGPQHGKERPETTPLKDKVSPDAEACYLIMWGEIGISEERIRKAVKAGFNWDIMEINYAGMFENYLDEQTLKRFAGSVTDEPILVIAEAWEAPGKAIEHFLRRLRPNVKKNRAIIIGLINMDSENNLIQPDRTDWLNWQEAVAKLFDPFVVIEPILESGQ